MGSLYCSTQAKYVERTTNLVPAANDYTVVGETYIDSLPPNTGNAYANIWGMANGFGTYTEYTEISLGADSKVYLCVNNGAGGSDCTIGADVSAHTTFSWAYTRSGNSHKFYVNGILIDTLTLDISATTLTEMRLGSDGDGTGGTNNGQDLHYSYFREWDDTVLAFLDIVSEWNSPSAVFTGVFTDTPLTADLLDDSGNGHTWTAHGSATIDTSFEWIPVALTNTTSGTAFTATVGVRYFQVPITSTIAVETWWKFTANPVLVQVGIMAFSDDYTPRIKPYQSDLTPVTGSQESQAANKTFMIPVTPGDDFYIRVRNVAVSPGPGALNFLITNSLNQDVPLGSILVPSDVGGWNAALIDTASEILQYKAFPSGEATAVLDSGIILTVDADISGRMSLFSNQLVKLLDIDSNYDKWITVSGDRTFFYVADNIGGIGKVTTVNADGSFGSTTWTLATSIEGFQGMAVSPDDTILYWKSNNRKVVKRHDLVNDLPLSDLTSEIVGFVIGAREILCLENGNILIPYYKPINNVNDAYFISYVGPDGVNIDNFAFTGDGIYATISRLAYAIEDPTHFWVWYELYDDATATDTNGTAAFLKIKISDGSIVTDIRVRLFGTAGAFGVFTPTPDTAVLGPSESCSFVILRADIPAVGEDTGTIVVVKITDPADDSTSFDFTSATLGSFSLSGGQSEIFDGLTPGVFDVAETANPDFTSTIEVSNGDDPSAITVGAGETVTVTVTNYKLEPLSGLYILVPDKRYDTLYSSIQYPGGGLDPTFTTEDLEIPEPSATLFLAGDE